MTDLDLLTQKNTERVNFQPKKIRRTPRHVYFEYPPWDLTTLDIIKYELKEVSVESSHKMDQG